jgi:tetratricopeptide (TPR) repeat protein
VSPEAAAPRPVEIFYSYAHEDRSLRERLENHLKFLQRQGLISQWTDRLLSPGTNWDREINDSLDRAGVILLLLSEYFLASDYIDGVEMKRAFERSAAENVRVVPVLLRDCLWREDKRLAILEPLPRNRKPVTLWRDRAAAFAEVASGIKGVAQEVVPQALYGVASSIPLRADAGARIAALPPLWNIPHRRDPAFIDRDAELAALTTHLHEARARERIIAVAGPPGIGKTSLVTEFAYRHAADYETVWWIRSKHAASLASDFPALAIALRLPAGGAAEPRELSRSLTEWLATSGKYLLIFDDAADPRAVLDLVPAEPGGHILLTTDATTIPRRARPLRLKPVSRTTSLDFLRQRLGPIDPATAQDVARWLGGVPLALGVAATYLRQSKASVRKFLGDLEQAGPDGSDGAGGPALALILARVEATTPVASDLLRLASFLAPEDIPLDDLTANARAVDDPLRAQLSDSATVDALVETLHGVGLAWRAGDAMFVHRSVQSLVRASLSDPEKAHWSEAAVTLVDAAFPADSRDTHTWRSCARLMPHALSAADYAEALRAAPLETGRLLRRLAVYLVGRAQLDDAKAAAARALAIHQANLGEENAEVAADLVTLGRVHQARDDLSAARDCFTRAVEIDEAVYGPNDPKVAQVLIYLGRFLRRIGDLKAAEEVLTRAIYLTEQARGADDREVGWALGHLGRVLQDRRKLPEARVALERALAIDEVALGPGHQDVATDLVNLARVLRELKELDPAEANLARALGIATREYGPDHYEVAIVEANLGRVMQDRGDLGAAEGHLEKAVAILQASLGEDHSYTSTARDWLRAVQRARAKAG